MVSLAWLSTAFAVDQNANWCSSFRPTEFAGTYDTSEAQTPSTGTEHILFLGSKGEEIGLSSPGPEWHIHVYTPHNYIIADYHDFRVLLMYREVGRSAVRI